MKYKVGDEVRIKSIDWYNENKNNFGKVWCAQGRIPFDPDMSKYCGKVMTISHVWADHYIMVDDLANYGKDLAEYWTDEMIEGLVEEESRIDLTVKGEEIKEHTEIVIPEGYVFKDENGNVINATKIVLEKKKKEYPKTYVECSDILSVYTDPDIDGYKGELLWTFQKLLICRDAYWKIAGEEMGLGKPWEPDWKNSEERRYCIVNIEGDINLPEKILTKWILKVTNKIFVFPTMEMRDAFKENFDSDIEICKELL